MAARNRAAVRNGIEITFTPIPGHVKADGEPEGAGAANRQTEKEAYDDYGEDADGFFAGVETVHCSKEDGEQGGGRPETHSEGKHPERIAAREEVFEESDDQKKYRVVKPKL